MVLPQFVLAKAEMPTLTLELVLVVAEGCHHSQYRVELYWEKLLRCSKQRYYYDNNSVSKRIVSEQHLKQKHKETCLLFYYSVMHVETELLLYIIHKVKVTDKYPIKVLIILLLLLFQ